MFLKRATYNVNEIFIYIDNDSCRIVPSITYKGEVKFKYNPDTNIVLVSIISKQSVARARIQTETNTIDIEEVSFTTFQNYLDINKKESIIYASDNDANVSLSYTIDKDKNEFLITIRYVDTEYSVHTGTFIFNIEHE